MRKATGFGICLALLCAAFATTAADRGSGHFRKGETRIDLKHVIAVANDEDDGPRTFVYLSCWLLLAI